MLPARSTSPLIETKTKPGNAPLANSPNVWKPSASLRGSFRYQTDTTRTVILRLAPRPPTLLIASSVHISHETDPHSPIRNPKWHLSLSSGRSTRPADRLGQRLSRCAVRPSTVAVLAPGIR